MTDSNCRCTWLMRPVWWPPYPQLYIWCLGRDSNSYSADYESAALPLSYQGTILVRLTGLEPVRPYGHQILSLVRLPITPQSQIWSGVQESNPHLGSRSPLYYPLYERQKTLLYYKFVVLSTRIKLVFHPYQGCVLSLYYKSAIVFS